MLRGVLDWFKQAVDGKEVDVIKKSELLLGLENLSNVMETNIAPLADKIEEGLKEGYIDEKSLVKICKLAKYPSKDGNDFVRKLRSYSKYLKTGIDDTKALVEDYMPNVLVTDNLSIRQSAILTIASQLDGAVGYLSDFLMFVVYELNGEKQVVYGNFSKRVAKSSSDFLVIMDSLSAKKSVYDRISDLSDVSINTDKAILRETASDYDLSFNIPSSNFNGNPFYFLGKWWVDFELKRAARYRDMKKITEYKIIQLREKKERGDVSTTIDKQIDYYEQRLTKYDAKIRRLEE